MPTQADNVYTQTRFGVSPETLSVISARNRIYAVPAWAQGSDAEAARKQIGVTSNFNPTETRAIEPVRGIGFGDRVMELVPGMTEPLTMTVTRTAQYLSMIMQVFGYKGGIDGICRSLRHHKYPFDVHQELIIGAIPMATGGVPAPDPSLGVMPATRGDQSVFPDGSINALNALITIYEACWMSDWSATFASDTALVNEDVTINVTDIVAQEGTPPTDISDVFAAGAISNFVRVAPQ